MQVNLTLDVEGKEVRLCRGKRNAVEFEGEEVRTGAKALEEGLKSIFGMDGELLSALTYRPQDTLGLFLAKDDSEKKEFLGQILGLNSVEAAVEESDSRRKKLLSDFTFMQGVLVEREAGLAKLLEQQSEISPDPEDTGLLSRMESAKAVVASMEAQVEVAKAQFDAAYKVFLAESEVTKRAKQERLAQAKVFLERVFEKQRGVENDLEARRDVLRTQISTLNYELNGLAAVRRQRADTQAKIVSLEKNECYVCRQRFTAEAAIDDEREVLAHLDRQLATEPAIQARLQEHVSKLKDLVPAVPDPNIAKLTKVVSDLEAEIKWLGKTITDTRVTAANEAHQNCLKNLATAKADFYDAENDWREFKRTVEVKARLRDKQEQARLQAIAQVEEKRAELARTESELNAEKDFIHVLGKDGFLGVIFDDVLAEIAKETNEILGGLPNTSHVSVAFRTENHKGKKAITPVFSVGSYETTRQSGLSGGMGASADLAVDLGVAAVVERRLGRSPGWLCLDETFNGMPRATKEAAIQAIQAYAASSDKLVIVIDHGSELRESFTKVLQVRSENGRSVV